MTGFHRHLRMFAVSALLVSAPLAHADEQTSRAAAERLRALLAAQDFTVEWDRIETEGTDAVLVDTVTGVDDRTVSLGDVELTGIARVDDGYRIENVWIGEYAGSDEDDAFTVSGVEMTGVILPDDDRLDAYGGSIFYDTLEIDRIELLADGETTMVVSGLYGEFTASVDGGPIGFSGGAEGFTLNPANFDEEPRLVLEALGYEEIEGHVEIAGSWRAEDGRLTVSEYDVTVLEAGTFSLSFDLEGFTREFIAATSEFQDQFADESDTDNSAFGMAVLGLMQQVTLHNLEIAFTDDTLTERILQFMADEQGVEPADVANQVKALVPMYLSQLGNPAFAATVAEAVSSFLDEPGNIVVRARPPAPAPIGPIVLGAIMAPQMLPQQLGLTVAANE